MIYIIINIFTKYIFFEIYILGIVSGLPFSLMYTAMVLWCTESGVSLAVASRFGFARTPFDFGMDRNCDNY